MFFIYSFLIAAKLERPQRDDNPQYPVKKPDGIPEYRDSVLISSTASPGVCPSAQHCRTGHPAGINRFLKKTKNRKIA